MTTQDEALLLFDGEDWGAGEQFIDATPRDRGGLTSIPQTAGRLMQIEMSEIVCRFGSTPAVAGVDLAVPEGEFLALLGPSGSGKTTLLRIIAGLEKPESGVLRIDGADAVDLAPNKRGIGFVFQHYALFRHMTVARNIAFGLEIRKAGHRPSKAEINRRVEELLDLVQLPGLGNRFPSQLSGGQRQRVALARALAIEPRILLLDEPFGALDTKVRSELRVWLKSLHRRLGITIVFVTHDQEEAMELADRVVIMRQGRLEQEGNPGAIYADPISPYVYSFLGAANALPVIIEAGIVRAAAGREILGTSDRFEGEATAWFRPHHVDLTRPGGWGESASLPGQVIDIATTGPRVRLQVAYHDITLSAEIATEDYAALGLSVGEPCQWRPRIIRCYPAGA
jgi:sulfate/thiosulfate transport system ATP-binding protein